MRSLISATLLAVCAVASNVVTYQGFDYDWRRKMVGFETPHRIGNIANYINQTEDATTAHYTFAPGVNGDYVFPKTWYSQHTSDTIMPTIPIQITWKDHVEGGKYPKTNVTNALSSLVSLPAGTLGVLAGWELDMECVEGPGLTCNGHSTKGGKVEGIWPYKFGVAVQQKPNGVVAEFTLGRGWTPEHGGGKALSTEMQYTATIYVQPVPQASWSSAKAPQVTSSSDLHEAPQSQKVCTSNTNGNATFAITGFNFELIETNNKQDLGRYIESLKFGIAPSGAAGCFDAWTGLTAPLTVVESKYTGELLLQELNMPSPVTQGAVNGTICVNGPYFHCANHGLKNDASDAVRF